MFDKEGIFKEDLGRKQTSFEAKMMNFEYDDLSSEEEVEQCRNWQPVPLNELFKNEMASHKNQQTDKISYLINIFGPVSVFLQEYKNYLIKKYLGTKEFDVETEFNLVSLLKQRFGAEELAEIETVLSDIQNNKIEIQKFSCAILTGRLWNLKETKQFEFESEVHSVLIERLEALKIGFRTKRSKIKSNLSSSYGKIEVKVNVDSKEFRFVLSPLTYALLTLVQSKPGREEKEYTEMLKSNENSFSESLKFLLHQGLIRKEQEKILVGVKINGEEGLIYEKEAFIPAFEAGEDKIIRFESTIAQIVSSRAKSNFKDIKRILQIRTNQEIEDRQLSDILGKMKIDMSIYEDNGHFYPILG